MQVLYFDGHRLVIYDRSSADYILVFRKATNLKEEVSERKTSDLIHISASKFTIIFNVFNSTHDYKHPLSLLILKKKAPMLIILILLYLCYTVAEILLLNLNKLCNRFTIDLAEYLLNKCITQDEPAQHFKRQNSSDGEGNLTVITDQPVHYNFEYLEGMDKDHESPMDKDHESPILDCMVSLHF